MDDSLFDVVIKSPETGEEHTITLDISKNDAVTILAEALRDMAQKTKTERESK